MLKVTNIDKRKRPLELFSRKIKFLETEIFENSYYEYSKGKVDSLVRLGIIRIKLDTQPVPRVESVPMINDSPVDTSAPVEPVTESTDIAPEIEAVEIVNEDMQKAVEEENKRLSELEAKMNEAQQAEEKPTEKKTEKKTTKKE